MKVLPALSFFFFLFFSFLSSSGGNVTYDRRSLIFDGQRRLIISASIHYPRSVPAMWPDLVKTAKDGGANAVETYVFWNGHEHAEPFKYNFEGRFDLVKFVKIVQLAGMYLILRIGPFVAAEWNFGGVPVWLHYVPGTVFRTDNNNFKYHMKRFMMYMVNLMKQEHFFAWQGGPIILAQVENEYGDIESVYGEGGKRYAMWAAKMAVSQDTGVPWIMCQQYDAPDPVINTCNSFYCDQFKPISPLKPKIWTENWTGWFQTFGTPNPSRPAEDIAYAVARFFQKGGSVQNYYMYHGGTNFGRTSGGPFITTSYDYDAPIDEYGLARLPKWAHLKELHKAIKLCESALLYSESTNLILGPSLEADVFENASGQCVAFLANSDAENDHIVEFRNTSYRLPAWSVSILLDCKVVVFNTAMVTSQTAVVEMVAEELRYEGSRALQWEEFAEKGGIWGKADFIENGLVDHINTTRDVTDYLWCTTSFIIGENEEFISNGNLPIISIDSKGHALHAYVNQKFQGSASGNGSHSSCKFSSPVSFKAGRNEISILSMTVGLQNAGPFYEWFGSGLTSVKIEGLNNGTVDLSTSTWTYKVGLQGEELGLYKPNGTGGGNWVTVPSPPKQQPLTWHKVVVDAPAGDEPVGLDMLHLGKGFAWLNGEEIGRYWLRRSSSVDNCTTECNHRGKFMPKKCLTGCGEPTQRWYHVPRSWFKPTGNVLVIFEEEGGDPGRITLARRKVTRVCSLVAEDYPANGLEPLQNAHHGSYTSQAFVHLKCPRNTLISSINFASFGDPTGTCRSYRKGNCHDPNSVSVVQKACQDREECVVELSGDNFRADLCPGKIKKLAVEASCT